MWQIISLYISPIIMLIGVLLFGKIVLNEKIKIGNDKFIILMILLIILQKITYLNLNGVLKTSILFFSNTLFYKIVFKIQLKKSLFLTFVYMVLLIITEVMELYILTEIFGMSREFCYETYAGTIISSVVIYMLFIPLTFLLQKGLRRLINQNIENNTKIIIFSLLTLICSLMFFYIFIREYRFSNDIVIYIISISVLVTVLFSLIKQTIENNKLSKEYDQLLEFMTTYETEIENQRILRHEIKNEFRTIRAKICDKQQNKEIIEYIDEIVNDKYEVKQEKYAKLGYLPPNGIKGLCYFKTQEAENKGITVSLNISKRIKESSIYKLNVKQQRDFGRILGVFLDNAIEASIESKDKRLGLEAYTNSKQEFKLIITNTHNNEIDEDKIGKEVFSTKGKNRGHGLLLVNQLIVNNDIFEIKTDIQNELYIQTITVKEIIDQENL